MTGFEEHTKAGLGRYDSVRRDYTMDDVTRVLEERYPEGARENTWFGHRTRLTVEGRPPKS